MVNGGSVGGTNVAGVGVLMVAHTNSGCGSLNLIEKFCFNDIEICSVAVVDAVLVVVTRIDKGVCGVGEAFGGALLSILISSGASAIL